MAKSKLKRRLSGSNVSMKCKTCQKPVKDVDSNSVSVICYKCVARQLNPSTIFVDELSTDEWNSIRRKL